MLLLQISVGRHRAEFLESCSFRTHENDVIIQYGNRRAELPLADRVLKEELSYFVIKKITLLETLCNFMRGDL